MRAFLVGSLTTALALTGLSALTTTSARANPAGTDLVISEVYGGGGNGGATWTHDFIELHNPTDEPISVDQKSLQYRSATSKSAPGPSNVHVLADAEVPAHGYYLVRCDDNNGSGVGAPLPTDADETACGLALSGSSGQVFLADVTTPVDADGDVNGSNPTDTEVIDFVGYGSAAVREGAAATGGLSSTTSVSRDADGTDTDQNGGAEGDFTILSGSAMTPTNSAGGAALPLAATDPGDKTFAQGTPIVPITLTANGGTTPYTWTISSGTLPAGLELVDGVISGEPTTAAGPVEITVRVTDSADPGATAETTFTITITEPIPITPIHEIQGTGTRSPFAPATGNGSGTEVKSTEGVVTAAYPVGGFNGLYIQTPGTDTADASDGIFVYGGSGNVNIPAGIAVGDSVRVTGPIAEFYDLTQIVPGAGGVTRLDTSLGTVTPKAVAFPTTDAAREVLEGELLAPSGTLTISNVYQTNQYGEIGLAVGDSPLKQPSEYAAPTDAAALQAVKDQNAERGVVLDDGSTTNYLQNQANKGLPVPWLTGSDGGAVASPPRVGAALTFTAPVVLDWRNDAWKLQPQGQVTTNGSEVATFEDTRAQNAAPQAVGGNVKLATFNVLNYFNTTGEAYAAAGPNQNPPLDTHCTYYTDRQGNRIGNNSCGTRGPGIAPPNDGRGPRGAATDESLARQEAKLARTLVALDADVVALEEVENSIKLPGETNRDDALARITELLNELEGAGTWKYVRSPGEATTAAAIAEQDVIRNAFIYKPAAVTPVGQSDILFGTAEFTNAREPLAQAFKKAGGKDEDAFAVIANHFKSKGDNQSPAPPATGDNAETEDTGAFNGDRKRQATRLLQFADEFADERGIEAVFLAGDFNSYSKEEPVGIIEAGGYEQVESDTAGEESYSHSGLSGSLDHVFANAAAQALTTGADIWEINANEAISYQYSRYNYNVTDLWQPNLPFATSDHNPEIVGLNLPTDTAPTYQEIQVLGTNDFHGRLLPDGGNAAGAAPFASAVKELRAENPNTIFVAAGDLVGASTFESFIQDDKPTIDALNKMGLEVSAAGNHEFDQGYADLAGRIRSAAQWEYIAANLDYADAIAEEDRLAETWTKEIDGKTVGFVGAVTEDLPQLVNQAGIEGITVTDVVEATNAAAADLKAAGADLVILLVHEGAPSTSCTSPAFTDAATTWGNVVANTSADVDAIISGHTHLAYNCKITVDAWSGRDVTKRPVVSAGQYGTNLNKLVFKFDGDNLAAIGQEVVGVAGVGHQPDPEVQPIVDAAVTHAETEGSKPLGWMDGDFKRASYNPGGNATENRGGESTLNNQVAEVQRWSTDAAGVPTDVAFMNPGGLRADMPVLVVDQDYLDAHPDSPAQIGDEILTYRNAADVQPFANTLVNMKLTGAQIETVLEQQWQRGADGSVPTRPFLRLGVSSGFTYTYSEKPVTVDGIPNRAPVDTFEGEVTGMWLDGEPVNLTQTYSVTVNSFLGEGGDNFWELANGTEKIDTGKVDLEAMVDYMSAYGAEKPLTVDYSQRAVELNLPADAPDTYAAGDTVAVDVASWALSAGGDKKDTEITVKLGETVLGTFPVDNAIGADPYDDYGTAAVSVTLPDGLPSGVTELTLEGATTGTSVPLLINVAGAEPGATEIQILGTNDFHGRILENAGNREGGAAVLSGAVKQLRNENENTLFVAAGDLIGASTFDSFIQQDRPTIQALNEAGLDVSAVGNHELDQGYDDLIDRVLKPYDATSNPYGGAAWQYLAANLKMKATGDPAVPATWIKTVDGVDVGFVGAVTEDLPTLVSPSGIDGLEVTDVVDSVNTEAEELRAEGADLVIMLVHEGAATTDCTSPQFTDAGTVWGNITQNVSSDVDAIVSGHTHLAYNCSFPVADWADRAVTERPVVSAGQYGMNLNQLVFTVTDGNVSGLETAVLPLMSTDPDGDGPAKPTPLYPVDPAVTAIVSDAETRADELGAVKLGQIEAPFNRAKLTDGSTENRGGESTLGNLVAEVQRWATENPESGSAQIAFMNPGGLRQDMAGTVNGAARDLTYKEAAVVQPFANTLVNMDLTGAQIETVLEQQWQRTAEGKVPSKPFLRLGVSEGFTYTYVERPVTVSGTPTFAGEVTGMWLNGEPIDLTATYSVTVNSFLASGGDNFAELAKGAGKADTGKVDLQAMVDYLAARAATAPLPVDYTQRAVEVEFPAGAPASYAPGDEVVFDVGSWSMSTGDDVKDAKVEVKLGDESLGTFDLDNAVSGDPYDQSGKAAVTLTLPADLPLGTAELTLTGAETGSTTSVVLAIAKPALANIALPTISGRRMVGATLTANNGRWSATPDSYAYQWTASGRPIAGATGRTLRLTRAQLARPISVVVTARKAGQPDGVATARPIGPVLKGVVRMTTAVQPSPQISRRTRPTIVVRPANADGLPATGWVRIYVSGRPVRTVPLVNGYARATYVRFGKRGLKQVTAIYLGNADLYPALIRTSFRVRR